MFSLVPTPQGLGTRWAIRRVLQAVVEAGQLDVARALVETSTTDRGAGVSGTEGGGGGGVEGASGAHKNEEVGGKMHPASLATYVLLLWVWWRWKAFVGKIWLARFSWLFF